MPIRALQLLTAFLVVYLVWGSTYLAIRVAVTALPPWLMAGSRMLVGGAALALLALALGHRWPRGWRALGTVALSATLMMPGSNGLVSWAEHAIPSNHAALILASSALWMAAFGSLGREGERLSGWRVLGLVIGFGGVLLLLIGALEAQVAPAMTYAVLMLAPVFWSLGSVFARRHRVEGSVVVLAALQMLIGGVEMSAIGLLSGEAARWTWTAPDALWAWSYLVVFGSCIAYLAYAWLMREVSPALLGTYAYVNPAVAVLLGWWWLDESLTVLQALGTVIIVASVLLLSLGGRRPAPASADQRRA